MKTAAEKEQNKNEREKLRFACLELASKKVIGDQAAMGRPIIDTTFDSIVTQAMRYYNYVKTGRKQAVEWQKNPNQQTGRNSNQQN